jgi:hypothetical protein
MVFAILPDRRFGQGKVARRVSSIPESNAAIIGRTPRKEKQASAVFL